MFCSKCATELPDTAVACYHCGTVTDVTFVKSINQHKISQPRPIVSNGMWIAGIAAVALLAAAILFTGLRLGEARTDPTARNAATPAAPNVESKVQAQTPIPTVTTEEPPPATPARSERIDVFRGTLQTSAGVGQNDVFSFVAERDGQLFGRLEGTGGIKGEYETYILNDQQYIDYKNSRTESTVWSSNGPLVVTVIKGVRVKAGERYYLLIVNKSGWTGRQVSGGIELR